MIGWVLKVILATFPDASSDQDAGPVLAGIVCSPHVALGVIPDGKDVKVGGKDLAAGWRMFIVQLLLQLLLRNHIRRFVGLACIRPLVYSA